MVCAIEFLIEAVFVLYTNCVASFSTVRSLGRLHITALLDLLTFNSFATHFYISVENTTQIYRQHFELTNQMIDSIGFIRGQMDVFT
jgi:hypothetical protein